MPSLRTLTRRWLPISLKRSFQHAIPGYDSYAPSFSSAGEDMILRHILGSDTGYELCAQNVIILDKINEYFLIDRTNKHQRS